MPKILHIITGSIAATKVPEIISGLHDKGFDNHCVITNSGEKFISVTELEKISGNAVNTQLFNPDDINDMEHIDLSRMVDLILVAPASADIMAKMANGIADDLASTLLLAADKKIILAPAMNVQMWNNAATKRNVNILKNDGVIFIGPEEGDLACGEYGLGRMSEPENIVASVEEIFQKKDRLKGKKIIITAGPTQEPLDPVRYISNHSSGKQGYAIAAEFAECGAEVVLVSGVCESLGSYNSPLMGESDSGIESGGGEEPSAKNISPLEPKIPTLPQEGNIFTTTIRTAEEMHKAVIDNLPADIVVCAGAVADWKLQNVPEHKQKKNSEDSLQLNLVQNIDILKSVCEHEKRPEIVVGFAAETDNLIENAQNKLAKKKCDFILANDVSGGKVFGSDENHIFLISENEIDDWGDLTKREVSERLVEVLFKRL